MGGRRVLWVSTSADLRYDARRDLDDLAAAQDDIPVVPPVRGGRCGHARACVSCQWDGLQPVAGIPVVPPLREAGA
jgi:hypothetical protein